MLGTQLYGPYGTLRYLAGSMGTTKGFTGQYGDSLSGLDYYHARYYDPVVGLFLSADKVQGNPQGLDSYSYVGDNPETHTDPTGQRVMCEQDCGSGGNDPTPPPPPTGHKQGSGPVGPCGPYDDCNSPPPAGNPPHHASSPLQHVSRCGFVCGGIKNGGLFTQGVVEILGAASAIIAAVIGAFQSGGLLWLLAQGFQYVSSLALGVMKNGISNVENSLAGGPSKVVKIVLDFLQLFSDIAADLISAVGAVKNVFKIMRYPGSNFATKWGGVVKAAGTLGASNMSHATVQLAISTVATTLNTLFGGDYLLNDTEQLIADIRSSN